MCETCATIKPEVVAQLVNEMRAQIQEMKTIIESVTEKLSKDPNTRVATSQERRAKPNRKSSWTLSSKVISITEPLKIPPLDEQGHGTKRWGAGIGPAQEQGLLQERIDLSPWKQASICQIGKIQMNTKMKNQEAHSKCPQEQSRIRIKHCNAQGSTKPL